MPLTATQIKSECQLDPAGIGLTPLYDNGQDQDVANALNLVRAGVAYSIYKKMVPIKELIASFDTTEFNGAGFTQLKVSKMALLFTGSAVLDATDQNTRDLVTGLLSGLPNTIANFAVVAKKQGSRAEVLGGDGTVVTASQVAQSRSA